MYSENFKLNKCFDLLKENVGYSPSLFCQRNAFSVFKGEKCCFTGDCKWPCKSVFTYSALDVNEPDVMKDCRKISLMSKTHDSRFYDSLLQMSDVILGITQSPLNREFHKKWHMEISQHQCCLSIANFSYSGAFVYKHNLLWEHARNSKYS